MSRRSSKENKGGGAKGPPPAPDIYVGLLLVALAAITFGCVMLALELNNYGWQMPT